MLTCVLPLQHQHFLIQLIMTTGGVLFLMSLLLTAVYMSSVFTYYDTFATPLSPGCCVQSHVNIEFSPTTTLLPHHCPVCCICVVYKVMKSCKYRIPPNYDTFATLLSPGCWMSHIYSLQSCKYPPTTIYTFATPLSPGCCMCRIQSCKYWRECGSWLD